MRSVDSLLINKEMGRGSSCPKLDLETLESDVPSSTGQWMAKQQCSSTCFRQSNEETRRHVVSVVLKGVRRQSSWTRSASSSRRNRANLVEFLVKSHDSVQDQFTKGSAFVALASTGHPHSDPSAGTSHP